MVIKIKSLKYTFRYAKITSLKYIESLIEGRIVSDFEKRIFAALNFPADEYKVFAEAKSKFYINSPKPILQFISLSQQLLNRAKERGKVYEEQILLEFLKNL